MANPMLQKIIDKKKAEGNPMSDQHKQAKSSVLGDLMKHLSGMGMDKMNGMKKVMVASNSKEGLSHGLEKAIDVVQHEPLDGIEDSDTSDHGQNQHSDSSEPMVEGSPEEESSESPEEAKSEGDQSMEDLKKENEALKMQLFKKHMKI